MKDLPWPEIQGPVWRGSCNHDPDSYICSFEIGFVHGPNDKTLCRFDLYLFANSGRHQVHIINGACGNDLCLCCELGAFLFWAMDIVHSDDGTSRVIPLYRHAAELLLKHGFVTYTKHNHRKDT